MLRDIVIKSRWSNEMSPAEIEDWRNVVNSVFGFFCTDDYFKRKYLDNIFGPSLLTVVYFNDKPIAADAFWRNDISGIESYQTTDTCVLSEYRRKGIYSAMLSDHLLNPILAKRFIYGFPNSNSYPCRIRMGWDHRLLYKHPVLLPFMFCGSLPVIHADYALWWLSSRSRVFRWNNLGKYFLVRKTTLNRVFCILGRIDKETALKFPKVERIPILTYHYSFKPNALGRIANPVPVVYYNGRSIANNVEFWNVDFV